MARCSECGDPYDDARAAIGHSTCLTCGERIARSRKIGILEQHKQSAAVVVDPSNIKLYHNHKR